MGAPQFVTVPPTEPGHVANFELDVTAPSQPGTYRGNWRLQNPQGTYFGDQIWVQLTVADPAGNNDPVPGGASSVELTCLECPSTLGAGETFRPNIRVTVNSGELLASRGDMLRNVDGNLFGAFGHVAVQGSVLPGQSQDFVFYVEHPITAPDTPGTYESQWRIWRNGGFVGPTLTIRFAVEQSAPTNRQPNPPRLSGPGDWAVYQGTSGIQLSAEDAGDPDGDPITGYYFEIFESAQNANSGWISSNSWSPPTSLGFNNYQWRAKVRDSRGGESGWSSDTWHFTILNSAVQISDFRAETCRTAWGGSDKICFCASTNAGTLKLQINTANDGSERGNWHTINELGTSNYNCADDADRPPNFDPFSYQSGTHKVRLYARGDGGWENAAIRDITVDIPADSRPGTPHGVLPQNGAYIASRDVLFDWVDTPRTSSYRLQVATDAAFSAFLLDTTLNSSQSEYRWTAADEYASIYWRVTATGPYGSSTASQSFHIDESPPTASFDALPLASYDTKFSLSWAGTDARSGLRWYHVQVRDGNRNGSDWADWLVNTTQTTEIFAGQPGHVYSFRVRAMDQVGNWGTWPNDDGNGSVLVDPTSMPESPWWDGGYSTKRNLIVTNQDTDSMPTGYPVRIHLDATTSPTAAEIFSASRAADSGNDVRIVYNNAFELERWVQRFSATEIDIWFPIQVSLGSGQTDSASYQLYYGNDQTGNPPANVNIVFMPEVDGNTVGLWRFQEASGNTVSDVSGRNHTGNFIGSDWVDGYLGWAGRFNGTNSYVEIPHSDDFRPGAITLEAWIYLTEAPSDYPMLFNKDRYWMRITGDGQVQFSLKADGGDRTIKGQTQLSQNQWYHVAATYDGNQQLRVYVNGKLDAEQTNGAPPVAWNTQPLRIGRTDYSGDSYFPGYIQHARVSDVARTDFPYGAIDSPPSVAVGSIIVPPVHGAADLVIRNVRTYPADRGKVVVEVTVENIGSRATENHAYVDLYLDELPDVSQAAERAFKFWLNDSIEPGRTVILTTEIDSFEMQVNGAAPAIPGSEVSHLVYGRIDTFNAVKETDESNNVSAVGVTACLAAPDAYEGDDTPEQASELLVDQEHHHNFTNLGDEDWMKFAAVADTNYWIATSNLGDLADTYLYLYDTDGVTLLTSNDDSGDSLASGFEWTAPASGTYYLLVQHWNPNVSGCGTGYTVQVRSACPPPLPAPSIQIGDLDGDGDVDNTDVELLQADFNREGCPGWIPADLDQNGVVNVFDYNILISHFGEHSGPPVSPISPEIPTLLAPSEGSEILEGETIVIEWSRPDTAVTFNVEILRDERELVDKLAETEATLWEIGVLPVGDYLVRIQALNDASKSSGWGSYRFSVVSTAPDPIVTPAPQKEVYLPVIQNR